MFTSLQQLLNKTLFNKAEFVQKSMHGFFHPESDRNVRRLQFFWVACGGVGLLLLSYGLVSFLYSASPLAQTEKPKEQATFIETALSKVDVYDAWRHKIEDLLDTLSKRTESVEKLFQEGIKNGDFSQTSASEEEELEDSLVVDVPKIDIPQGENANHTSVGSAPLQELNDRLSELEEKLSQTSCPGSQDSGTHITSVNDTSRQNEGSVIQKVTLRLVDGPHHKQPHTVETTIPAGAFAKTVLLSGLDASSAMNASSDPRPMLLRIIDHGTLPRRFQSDLKDCHCTAGAYGDLSSERVYARLEKLTCIDRKTGEILETQVAGYVSGSDGKAGIRGIVASRDGQFLARSLMGGIFSGLSNVANPQNRRAQVSPFAGALPGVGPAMAAPSIGENFMSGMSSGATSALDRLSQYYIDRAEQLQPVIQIAAGQVVDIVFTGGASLSNQLSVISHQNAEVNNNLASENHHNQRGE